jgi:hypothetical protein
VAEVRTGVRCTLPAIRAAADRTASAFTLTSSPSMHAVNTNGEEVARRCSPAARLEKGRHRPLEVATVHDPRHRVGGPDLRQATSPRDFRDLGGIERTVDDAVGPDSQAKVWHGALERLDVQILGLRGRRKATVKASMTALRSGPGPNRLRSRRALPDSST